MLADGDYSELEPYYDLTESDDDLCMLVFYQTDETSRDTKGYVTYISSIANIDTHNASHKIMIMFDTQSQLIYTEYEIDEKSKKIVASSLKRKFALITSLDLNQNIDAIKLDPVTLRDGDKRELELGWRLVSVNKMTQAEANLAAKSIQLDYKHSFNRALTVYRNELCYSRAYSKTARGELNAGLPVRCVPFDSRTLGKTETGSKMSKILQMASLVHPPNGRLLVTALAAYDYNKQLVILASYAKINFSNQTRRYYKMYLAIPHNTNATELKTTIDKNKLELESPYITDITYMSNDGHKCGPRVVAMHKRGLIDIVAPGEVESQLVRNMSRQERANIRIPNNEPLKRQMALHIHKNTAYVFASENLLRIFDASMSDDCKSLTFANQRTSLQSEFLFRYNNPSGQFAKTLRYSNNLLCRQDDCLLPVTESTLGVELNAADKLKITSDDVNWPLVVPDVSAPDSGADDEPQLAGSAAPGSGSSTTFFIIVAVIALMILGCIFYYCCCSKDSSEDFAPLTTSKRAPKSVQAPAPPPPPPQVAPPVAVLVKSSEKRAPIRETIEPKKQAQHSDHKPEQSPRVVNEVVKKHNSASKPQSLSGSSSKPSSPAHSRSHSQTPNTSPATTNRSPMTTPPAYSSPSQAASSNSASRDTTPANSPSNKNAANLNNSAAGTKSPALVAKKSTASNKSNKSNKSHSGNKSKRSKHRHSKH